MKRCPRCDRGCQNKYETVCGECAHAEYLLRLDPFAVAAAFADATDRDTDEEDPTRDHR